MIGAAAMRRLAALRRTTPVVLQSEMAECGLAEAQAQAALAAANWDLRVALVMQKARVPQAQAVAALQQSGFTIAQAVELARQS